jgi:hypothetical protein
MKALFDEGEVRRALAILIQRKAVFEVRALSAQLKGQRYRAGVSGYFNNADHLLKELEHLYQADGIYVMLNPVNPALLSRRANRLDYAEQGALTSNHHILARHWLLVDVDPRRPSGVSSTDQEKAAAKKKAREIHSYLKARGWPEPIAADSGNGYHLLYPINLPTMDGGLVEKLLTGLAECFDDDVVQLDRSVFNPARIVKLYGTLSCKGDNTEERPHRMSKLLTVPNPLQQVSREQLQELVKELPQPEPGATPKERGGKPLDVDEFLSRHHVEVVKKFVDSLGRTIWRLKNCVFNPDHVNGEAAIVRQPGGVLGYECKHTSCAGKHWQDFRQQFEPEYQANGGQEKAKEKAPSKSIATQLCELAKDYAFFHDRQDRPFVRVEIEGHTEVWPVESGRFRKLLARAFYKAKKRTANRNALTDAVTTLAGIACHDSPEEPVFIRVAWHDGNILIDLCDQRWRVIEVTPEGWQVLDRSPVAFIRTGSMQALPFPVPGGSGSIKPLWDLLNVSEKQRPLVAGALLIYFHPDGPYFVLIFVGEQGTAKSCAARLIRQLIDPNENPLRSPSKEERDLLAQAANNWCVAFDNLSYLPLWLSDAVCRLATGGGHSARTLYTDLEEVSLAVKRPVILNGIEDVARRPDLAERALQIELETIEDEKRISEKDLWQRFEKERAVIFTAILDALVCALRQLPSVTLNPLPRMADAALWATAAETALGFEPETFIAAYKQNLHEGAVASVEAHPVGQAIRKLLENQDEWSGKPEQLLEELNLLVSEETRRQRSWPKSASALGRYLRRLAPALRKAGIRCEWIRTSEARTITLGKVGKKPSQTSQTSFTQKESESVPRHAPSPESPSPSSVPQSDDRDDRKDGNFPGPQSDGSEVPREAAAPPAAPPIVGDEFGVGRL